MDDDVKNEIWVELENSDLISAEHRFINRDGIVEPVSKKNYGLSYADWIASWRVVYGRYEKIIVVENKVPVTSPAQEKETNEGDRLMKFFFGISKNG